MKYTIIILLVGIHSLVFGQFETPREIVQEQLDAYNEGDIDRFMAVFSPNIQLFTLGEKGPLVEGKDKVRSVYTNLFDKSPDLKSEVINRTIIGNKVIDYEIITGRNGDASPMYLVMVYEVEEGLIIRAHAVRE